MTDPHDRREFRQFVKLNANGTVAGVIQIAAGSPAPTDRLLVDVTDHFPNAVDTITVKPAVVDKVQQTAATVADAKAAVMAAEEAHEDARAQLAAATHQAVLAVSAVKVDPVIPKVPG